MQLGGGGGGAVVRCGLCMRLVTKNDDLDAWFRSLEMIPLVPILSNPTVCVCTGVLVA